MIPIYMSDDLVLRNAPIDAEKRVILSEKDQVKLLKYMWKYRRELCSRVFLK